MGHKRQFPAAFNWQSTSPVVKFLPLPANQTGSTPSGVLAGAMSATDTIYSQIIEISLVDNIGLEITWTGNPSGALSIYCSNSGIYFYPLSLCLTGLQPAGTAGGYLLNLNNIPFKYFFVQYVNTTGSGSLYIYTQAKDLN